MKTYRQIVCDLRQQYPEGEAQALARWLCEECFGLSQTDILLDKDNDLSADSIAKSKEIVQRLLRHEPIQYILGYTTFCGHQFHTAPGALIPRPETEQLVNLILESNKSQRPHILDIGTGTGCIALSLALGLPEASVTAWDVSDEALVVARQNMELFPDAKVVFEKTDILSPPNDDRRWNVIVSNPPYVRRCESTEMDSNVLDYEPHLALFVSDDDPLVFYRAIAGYASKHLQKDGQLWFEINQYLGKETAHLIEEYGFADVQVLKDGFGHDRFIKCIR